MMVVFRRYCTAFNRYRRGRGFGIHSPFAFYFVLRELKERCPYYAFEQIDRACKTAPEGALPGSRAKMLFRVVNCFNPAAVLQIGSDPGGIVALAARAVSSKMCCYAAGGDAAAMGISRVGSEPLAFLVNSDATNVAVAQLELLLKRDSVIVMPGIDRSSANSHLWGDLKAAMAWGMSFSNGKLGVIVSNSKLPLHHYNLWF